MSQEQTLKLQRHNITIVEIEKLEHEDGLIQNIIFKDGKKTSVTALYVRSPFVQHCTIPESLGCELTEEEYIKVDILQRTTIHGVFASGDNTTRIRTVANAVAMGTTAGMMLNKEFVLEEFD